MSNGTAVVGTCLYIGTAQPTDLDQAGFEAITWTQVADIGEIPEHGVDEAEVTWESICRNATLKAKGIKNIVNMTFTYAVTRDGNQVQDPGQAAAIAAGETPFAYAYKLESPVGAAGFTGKTAYFRGKQSVVKDMGGANDLNREGFTIMPEQRLVVQPAAV